MLMAVPFSHIDKLVPNLPVLFHAMARIKGHTLPGPLLLR